MPKIQQIKNTFFISIPISKIKKKGWKKGTIIDYEEYPNGDLILKEVEK